jgi:hypothetical protein
VEVDRGVRGGWMDGREGDRANEREREKVWMGMDTGWGHGLMGSDARDHQPDSIKNSGPNPYIGNGHCTVCYQ